MKLTFTSPYLSITSLPECELPAFTVLTGLNGSGKTHLLQAIQNGQVKSSIVSDPKSDVRYYDWQSIAPNNADTYDSHGQAKTAATAYTIFNNLRKQYEPSFSQSLTALGLAHLTAGRAHDAAKLSSDRLADLLGDPKKAEDARAALDRTLESIWTNIRTSTRPPHPQGIQQQAIDALRTSRLRDLFVIDEEAFSDAIDPAWGQAEPFRQAFGQLFGLYRDLIVENRLRRLARDDGVPGPAPLSNEQFVAKYNGPPWEFVNRSLSGAGLDFSINAPPLHRFGPYKPVLTKKSTGTEIEFANLSSGERVLMSFALCVYYAQDRRQLSQYPRLLLLDEVDAPLHPSMCRQLVASITDTLVSTYGISVILATHSATTVAMAPESAVHIMRGNGVRIQKASKGVALNLLTDGVPTISVDFEGRRQVFVESLYDAAIYDRLYQLLKSKLGSERSLEFIGVGSNPSENSGCDQVKHVVKALFDGGNKSVHGLLDWDRRNVEGDRIMVLGSDERYSLENYILDPLLVAIAVVHEAPDFLSRSGLPQVTQYTWFQGKGAAELQPVVDVVTARVVVRTATADRSDLLYIGGLRLACDSEYLLMNGHELESKVTEAFPPLKRGGGSAGRLMKHIIDTVGRDFPAYLPAAFETCFSRILSTPSH